MKQKLTVFILAIFVLLLAACSSDSSTEESKNTESSEPKETETAEAKEITIKHLLGETAVKVNPENVVVFDFGVLETLDALGVDAVTALPKEGTVPSHLEKYTSDEYESVGSLKEPDFEKINELQPELIIISARQQDLYEDFQEIAPTIYLGVDTTKYMESFKENTEILGQIFDKEAEVKEELAKVDESIKALNEKASALEEKALVTLINEGNISAYGPASRFGIIHDVFGVKAVDENLEVSTHGQSISFEYIVEKDPEILFVVDRGAVVTTGQETSPAKEVLNNDLIKGTKAYKEDRIVYLDPNVWYLSGGGITSVKEMVKAIDESL
ncbi:siderophore ABC transporter substrate-binding protein [Niallia endozanthoxylica]|uniref:Siderophore ABC transporter substrate-binding protein n=1 Tax=Niallia endozanthoxylica TaxID=2036016 RepID=A0A5J5HJ25_9BACI|nr:siderophore ABC transporter substrate-binding protein [Niallia endozanthoxylica]KAA9020008.1 siderophore ABC transporter substrate-binding protein [Niallia endozanthoxylica]